MNQFSTLRHSILVVFSSLLIGTLALAETRKEPTQTFPQSCQVVFRKQWRPIAQQKRLEQPVTEIQAAIGQRQRRIGPAVQPDRGSRIH